MLKRSYGAFHVEHTSFLTLKTHRSNSHKMTHDSFGGDHTKLIISFNFVLKLNSQDFLSSLDQFKILLLSEFERCDFIMQHTNVS